MKDLRDGAGMPRIRMKGLRTGQECPGYGSAAGEAAPEAFLFRGGGLGLLAARA